MSHLRTEYFMRFKLPASMGTAKFKDGEPVLSDEEYVAFSAAKERRIRFRICPPMQYWRRFPYSQLMEIGEDGLAGTELLLGFAVAVIVIRGRNLTEIADAIAEERCDMIQAYDDRRWRKPIDKRAPFITSIMIYDARPEGSPESQKLQVSTEKSAAN